VHKYTQAGIYNWQGSHHRLSNLKCYWTRASCDCGRLQMWFRMMCV